MSVQLYVSGERPRSFPTLAAFVTYVRSIEDPRPAVASPAPARGSAGRSGAGNGASGRVSGPPSDQAGAPPSNETTGQGSHPCPAVGGPARPQKQV